jgi:6-phosphofructokinase 1
VFDRILATRMGIAAVDMLISGEHGKMVALQQNEMVGVELQKISGRQKLVPPELYATARTFFR